MARFEVILEQSGMPETTTHVMASGIRQLNGANNEARVQFEDAVNNMHTHTDYEGGESLDTHDNDEDGVFNRTVFQFTRNGYILRYRRVFVRRKP